MEKIKILICDGNTATDRISLKEFNGYTPSEQFQRILNNYCLDIDVEIAFPADPPPICLLPLEDYDGIIFTGSKSSIHKKEIGTIRQISFAKAAFESGTPIFGVCWGFQLGIVAAGGDVQPNRPHDVVCEVPFASGICLSEPGRAHPLHQGRPSRFDAFAYHFDEAVKLPDNAVVTAYNLHFVQAVEIKYGQSTFWGVQYHPELTGLDQAGFLREGAFSLISKGCFENIDQVHCVANELSCFEEGYEISKQCFDCFQDFSLGYFEFRPLELFNWVEHLVIPTVKSR